MSIKTFSGPFGSSPVSAKKKRPSGRLMAESTGLRDIVALSHKTSKFAMVLTPMLIKVFCAFADVFCRSIGKKHLAGLSVRALYPPQKNALPGVLMAESTGLEPVHRYSR